LNELIKLAKPINSRNVSHGTNVQGNNIQTGTSSRGPKQRIPGKGWISVGQDVSQARRKPWLGKIRFMIEFYKTEDVYVNDKDLFGRSVSRTEQKRT
jgi:hypothetical protein